MLLPIVLPADNPSTGQRAPRSAQSHRPLPRVALAGLGTGTTRTRGGKQGHSVPLHPSCIPIVPSPPLGWSFPDPNAGLASLWWLKEWLGSSKLKKMCLIPQSNLFRSNYAPVPVLNSLVPHCNDVCMKMG